MGITNTVNIIIVTFGRSQRLLLCDSNLAIEYHYYMKYIHILSVSEYHEIGINTCSVNCSYRSIRYQSVFYIISTHQLVENVGIWSRLYHTLQKVSSQKLFRFFLNVRVITEFFRVTKIVLYISIRIN